MRDAYIAARDDALTTFPATNINMTTVHVFTYYHKMKTEQYWQPVKGVEKDNEENGKSILGSWEHWLGVVNHFQRKHKWINM